MTMFCFSRFGRLNDAAPGDGRKAARITAAW